MFTRDRRAIFCIPWVERTVIGTTDTDEGGDPSDVAATAADVDYLCDHANPFFPASRITPDDVIATWAGLRPLIASEGGRASDVSREHQVFVQPDGVVVIAGGKLTTYRRMAKEAVDAVGALLANGGGRGRIPPCTTRRRPLPGAQGLSRRDAHGVADVARDLERTTAVGARVATHLAQTYGQHAMAVVARGQTSAALLERIDPELPYLWAEVHHAAEVELVRTVEDVLVRRIPLCLRSRDQGLGIAGRVGDVLAAALGWSPAETTRHVEAYRRYVERTRRFRGTSRGA